MYLRILSMHLMNATVTGFYCHGRSQRLLIRTSLVQIHFRWLHMFHVFVPDRFFFFFFQFTFILFSQWAYLFNPDLDGWWTAARSTGHNPLDPYLDSRDLQRRWISCRSRSRSAGFSPAQARHVPILAITNYGQALISLGYFSGPSFYLHERQDCNMCISNQFGQRKQQ